MASATEHPDIVSSYLMEEERLGRIVRVGSMEAAGTLSIHCSSFGVIPKKSRPGSWRLIVDLSAPEGHSVNDGICKEVASLSYISVDDVVACILKVGKAAVLAKIDVKQAYRIVPVHPDDRFLLGMCWQGSVFIDTKLPFGLRSAPLIFTALADALQWIIEQKGVRFVFHYIDDFITIGAPSADECSHNLSVIKEACRETGVPVEDKKTEGPTTSLTFLGLQLDTVALEISLPRDKLVSLREALTGWRGRKACRKRQLLSLIGTLSFACRAVRSGRTFLRRLITLSTRVSQLDHFVRISRTARADIEWWFHFSASWNGVSMMSVVKRSNPAVTLTSDASGSWGCGAFSDKDWFMLQWSGPIASFHITIKELAPIVLAAAIWGKKWRGKTVKVQCDNMAVVYLINDGSSRDEEAMHLLRCLAFISARFEFYMFAVHIRGVDNLLADALSRDKCALFLQLFPQASPQPTAIPAALLDLIILTKPDWTESSWTELWTNSFTTD